MYQSLQATFLKLNLLFEKCAALTKQFGFLLLRLYTRQYGSLILFNLFDLTQN